MSALVKRLVGKCKRDDGITESSIFSRVSAKAVCDVFAPVNNVRYRSGGGPARTRDRSGVESPQDGARFRIDRVEKTAVLSEEDEISGDRHAGIGWVVGADFPRDLAGGGIHCAIDSVLRDTRHVVRSGAPPGQSAATCVRRRGMECLRNVTSMVVDELGTWTVSHGWPLEATFSARLHDKSGFLRWRPLRSSDVPGRNRFDRVGSEGLDHRLGLRWPRMLPCGFGWDWSFIHLINRRAIATIENENITGLTGMRDRWGAI